MPKIIKRKGQKVVTEQYLDERLKQVVMASERRVIEAVRKEFTTKDDLKASEKRVISAMKTMMEIRDEELQGAHQDELDIVGGEKVAPVGWKSIPRRRQSVETEVTKIKDHLALP